MREQVLEKLGKWKEQLDKKVKHDGIYLFGSLVNNKGILFKKDKSDVDMMIVIPQQFENDFKARRDWIASLAEWKMLLEQELVILLQRTKTDEQIVSFLPVTRFELIGDLHKSNATPFFKSAPFIEIGTNKIVKGEELVEYIHFEDEILKQVIAAIQKSRNEYLASNSLGNISRLEFDEIGSLPKSLCREAAKVNFYFIDDDNLENRINLIYGLDFLKRQMQQFNSSNEELELVYYWASGSGNGLAQLTEEHVLLIHELLFDKAVEIYNSSKDSGSFDKYKISIKPDFEISINSTDLLSKSHPSERELYLEDILVHSDLETFDDLRESDTTIESTEFLANFLSYNKALLAGDGQSGKTVLCRLLFKQLVKQDFIPVYLNDRTNGYSGNFKSKLLKAFSAQLEVDVDFGEISTDRIIPIVDDFHFAKDKKKLINALKEFPHHLIVVDDIFELSFSNELMIKSYTHFKVKELTGVQRFELVEKWVELTLKGSNNPLDLNNKLEKIDSFVEVVETALGKLLGAGIMPSYPFFILSIISAYESSNSIKTEITSQGHCYYALICLYLINDGVDHKDLDDYLNLLTELAYYLYKNEGEELTPDKLEAFESKYKIDFNLTIDFGEILHHLASTNIFKQNSFNNYEFSYSYLYYYFTGKYFADNLISEESEVEFILDNLHNTDLAYIAIFISHHTKNPVLIEKLIAISKTLFTSYAESSLTKEELQFFDNQIELIAAAVLPSANNLPIQERKKRIEEKERLEKEIENSGIANDIQDNIDEDTDELLLELRRSSKTVEVMGRIIKNRSGSLKKKDLLEIFEMGMNIHLRALKSFIDLISVPECQLELVEYISDKIDIMIKEKEIDPDSSEIVKMAKEIFWNTNFMIIYGFIQKIVYSLGSNKLANITNEVCDKIQTPSAELIRHGILMWFSKNLQINEIKKALNDSKFSKTAANIMKYQIVEHSKTHKLDYKKLSKIESDIGISSRRLLIEHQKASKKK
ncbi:hypothetical protein [Ekhidna sp.]|uniref:STAND family AAA ATPase n=1 Tax=Ekhidna sp. TaxID=2608089 RepID=UPI00329A14F2